MKSQSFRVSDRLRHLQTNTHSKNNNDDDDGGGGVRFALNRGSSSSGDRDGCHGELVSVAEINSKREEIEASNKPKDGYSYQQYQRSRNKLQIERSWGELRTYMVRLKRDNEMRNKGKKSMPDYQNKVSQPLRNENSTYSHIDSSFGSDSGFNHVCEYDGVEDEGENDDDNEDEDTYQNNQDDQSEDDVEEFMKTPREKIEILDLKRIPRPGTPLTESKIEKLALMKLSKGEFHIDVVKTMCEVSQSYLACNRAKSCIYHCEKALKITSYMMYNRFTLFHDNHAINEQLVSIQVNAMTLLGMAYFKLGKFTECELILQRALKTNKLRMTDSEVNTPIDPEKVMSKDKSPFSEKLETNQGNQYSADDESNDPDDESLMRYDIYDHTLTPISELLDKTEKVENQQFSKLHFVVLIALGKVSAVLGHYENAEWYYTYAWQIKQKMGCNDLSLAAVYIELGSLFQMLPHKNSKYPTYESKIRVSIDMYKSAKRLIELHKGSSHVDLGHVNFILMILYQSIREYKKALPCGEKAYSISEMYQYVEQATNGAEIAKSTTFKYVTSWRFHILSCYAELLLKCSYFKEAKICIGKANDLLDEHTNLQVTPQEKMHFYKVYGAIMIAQRQLQQSFDSYFKALQLSAKLFGTQSEECTGLIAKLARLQVMIEMETR